MAFESAYGESEMLSFSAGVAVEDYGFCGAFEYVVEILQARCKVYRFDVGFAFLMWSL